MTGLVKFGRRWPALVVAIIVVASIMSGGYSHPASLLCKDARTMSKIMGVTPSLNTQMDVHFLLNGAAVACGSTFFSNQTVKVAYNLKAVSGEYLVAVAGATLDSSSKCSKHQIYGNVITSTVTQALTVQSGTVSAYAAACQTKGRPVYYSSTCQITLDPADSTKGSPIGTGTTTPSPTPATTGSSPSSPSTPFPSPQPTHGVSSSPVVSPDEISSATTGLNLGQMATGRKIQVILLIVGFVGVMIFAVFGMIMIMGGRDDGTQPAPTERLPVPKSSPPRVPNDLPYGMPVAMEITPQPGFMPELGTSNNTPKKAAVVSPKRANQVSAPKAKRPSRPVRENYSNITPSL